MVVRSGGTYDWAEYAAGEESYMHPPGLISTGDEVMIFTLFAGKFLAAADWMAASGAESQFVRIAAAEEGGVGGLRPLSSLNTRQAAILEVLSSPGATGTFRRGMVTLKDLRALSGVTGDEFSMYILDGQRFVIRGLGREILGTPELAEALKQGQYGRWVGHTHPPGSLLTATTYDRASIPFGQSRSFILGEEGTTMFFRTPVEDASFDAARRAALMRKFYEQQQ
jgi:hypothetical protein